MFLSGVWHIKNMPVKNPNKHKLESPLSKGVYYEAIFDGWPFSFFPDMAFLQSGWIKGLRMH